MDVNLFDDAHESECTWPAQAQGCLNAATSHSQCGTGARRRRDPGRGFALRSEAAHSEFQVGDSIDKVLWFSQVEMNIDVQANAIGEPGRLIRTLSNGPRFFAHGVPPTLIQLHAEHQTDRARLALLFEYANAKGIRVSCLLPPVREMKLTKNNLRGAGVGVSV